MKIKQDIYYISMDTNNLVMVLHFSCLTTKPKLCGLI